MKYTYTDFKSDQEVRWCPGCGDHAVLAAMQRAMPRVAEALGYEKERFVVVSGVHPDCRTIWIHTASTEYTGVPRPFPRE